MSFQDGSFGLSASSVHNTVLPMSSNSVVMSAGVGASMLVTQLETASRPQVKKDLTNKQTKHFKIVSFLMVCLTISSNYVRLCNLKLVPNFITKQRVNLFSQQTCHDFLIIGPLSTKVYSLCRWKSFTGKFFGFKLPQYVFRFCNFLEFRFFFRFSSFKLDERSS